MSGLLILCATPIGNLSDVSPRLRETLAAADLVLAEDTRRARQLLNHLEVSARLESYFAGNEHARKPLVEQTLAAGSTIAFITDAGMPAVSDPGMSAVRVARGVGADVSVVPGPSAALAALAVSGLPSERFVFEGFLPRKGAERTNRLAELSEEIRTMILFVATSRVVADLSDLGAVVGGGREVVVCRELTKRYEEVWAGTIDEAVVEWTERDPRGEFTVVVAGRTGDRPVMDVAVEDVQARVASGEPLSDAVRIVAESLGVRRRALYELVLRAEGR
jgi:16S rRNA (cytidine1402-2'-O)-methyltransferase